LTEVENIKGTTMGLPGGLELAAIVGVVILLFGGKKIPELAKGLGKGIKDFKKAVKDDDTEEASLEITDNNGKIEEKEETVKKKA